MTAIAGTFTKIEAIASRKVVRLHIEVSAEQADHVLDVLGGYPDAADPKWVALARLSGPPNVMLPKRSFHELPRSQQAGILCEDQKFRRFLSEVGSPWSSAGLVVSDVDEQKAADLTRDLCGVSSRSLFDTDEPSARRWDDLYSKYRAWLEAAE